MLLGLTGGGGRSATSAGGRPPSPSYGRGVEHDAWLPAAYALVPADIRADRCAFDAAGMRYATRTGDGRDANDRAGLPAVDHFDARLLVVHLAYPTALTALAPLAWSAG